MDQQKIDQLFREKLDHIEVTPSPQAWSEVEKTLQTKKSPMVYWIAASVSILLLSWIGWVNITPQESSTPIASAVSHPVELETPTLILPVIGKEDRETEKKVEVAPKKAQSNANVQFAAVKQSPVELQKIEEPIQLIEDEPETVVASIEIEETIQQSEMETIIQETEIEEPIKKEFKAVKITYIASATSQKEAVQKTDTTGALKKFIAFAGKLDPGDMLADIKTAKDNLLNGGLKSKKDRSSL